MNTTPKDMTDPMMAGMDATLPEETTPKRQHASTLNDAVTESEFPDAEPEAKAVHLMTDEEKDAELEVLADEILTETWEMESNDYKIRGILQDSIFRAKAIGDRLRRAKDLLPHGCYQSWVKAKTELSPATARAYKRVSENWTDIQSSLSITPRGMMSVRQALELLEDRESKFIFRYDDDSLMGQFERMVDEWPIEMQSALSGDFFFMHNIDTLCLKYYEIIKQRTGTWNLNKSYELQYRLVPKQVTEEDRKALEAKREREPFNPGEFWDEAPENCNRPLPTARDAQGNLRIFYSREEWMEWKESQAG